LTSPIDEESKLNDLSCWHLAPAEFMLATHEWLFCVACASAVTVAAYVVMHMVGTDRSC